MAPNIILIMSDQQRWDTLGCLGQDHMITPNLDSLAGEGLCLNRAFVQSTVCAPSRASIVSGKYVHTHGAIRNGKWPRPQEPNWIATLRDSGYHTANIGKMHTSPLRLPCGFEHRLVVENKNYNQDAPGLKGPDDYDLYLKEFGLKRPANQYPETVEDWWDQLQTVVWPLAEEHFPDHFVGRRTVNYIQEHDFDEKPLFLWAGFTGPHDPFDAPESAIQKYEGRPIPDPVTREGEAENKPPQHKRSMEKMDGWRQQAAVWWSRATPEKIRRMRRHYYANVTVIDQWVGRIAKTLEEKGELENTIIIYTSDHGDCLGDHNMIYKFSTHYESVVRVPLLFHGPGVEARGINNALIELSDLGPTLLELAGLDAEQDNTAESFAPVLRGETEQFRDSVFSECGNRTMVRTEDWKLVCYYGTPHGELYNAAEDPEELYNLWDDPEARDQRHRLTEALVDWFARTPFIVD